MAENPAAASKRGTHIIFRHVHPALQPISDEVLADGEAVEFDGEWLHVVTHDRLGGPTRLRSYPANGIDAVLHGD